MNILVTGQPGVGKTTLIFKVYQLLQQTYPHLSFHGFFTEEVRQNGERIGFDVVTLDGRRDTLSRVESSFSSSSRNSPRVGKYCVVVAGFEALALPELEVSTNTGLFVIDEIGKMELFSDNFFPAVLRALDSPCPVLASIPVPRYGRDIPQVNAVRSRTDVVVYTLTKATRDTAVEKIFSDLKSVIAGNISV